MNKIIISKLISVANNLDFLGSHEDADKLTRLADSFSAPMKEDIDERMDDSFSAGDDFAELQRILDEMVSSGEINEMQKSEIENIVNEGDMSSNMSSDEDSIGVKEFSNPIDSMDDEDMNSEPMPEPTDTSTVDDEDLESLFADDPELLNWWRNLGSNKDE
jgi:hypothetical protein